MSDERSGAGSVLVAFVLGAVAGAAVALLWAPASGEETRRKLQDRAREGRDKAVRSGAAGPRVPAHAARRAVDGVRAGQGGVRTGPRAEGERVSDWAGVWLGVIALSTLVMAVIQVGAIIYGARAARRLEVVLGRVETDIKPILERAQQVSTDAARMSALAAVQVERVDQVFTDLTQRVDQTATMIQQALVSPAREGAALFAAVRATIGALRGLRGHGRQTPPRGVEEDDALFIG